MRISAPRPPINSYFPAALHLWGELDIYGLKP